MNFILPLAMATTFIPDDNMNNPLNARGRQLLFLTYDISKSHVSKNDFVISNLKDKESFSDCFLPHVNYLELIKSRAIVEL